MIEEEYDMSKQWVKTYRVGEDMVMESNMPNDTIGDWAFEYDYGGVERKKWQEYVEDLERKGIRGQLVHQKMIWKYNPVLDDPNPMPANLSSYQFIVFDISDKTTEDGKDGI